ncbi:MAG TPA: BatA domain-containing protein, partial [Alphaproteobacteria bacterium]|nr:BatA domain-containing protein [Alphaproteobacteria bacterium]
MLSFGTFAFAAPWALVALAGLPILWWLLRVTPPAPRLLRFPAIRLLFGLRQDEQTPARTPLWLILLRMTIATLVILGLARPVLNPANQFDAPGPLMLVIDDGWAAARGWTQRIAAVDAMIARAQRSEKPILVLNTAPPDTGGPIQVSKLMTAGAARSLIQALEPKPWPSDREKALEALDALQLEQRANVVWLSDGIDEGGAIDFVNRLTTLGPVTVMADAPGKGALALPPPDTTTAQLKGTLLRAEAGDAESFWLRGTDDRGRVLMREQIRFASGARQAEAVLPLPPELRNRLTRLEVEEVGTAGTVALFDERWRRRPVGIITAATDKAQTRPLLSEIFYLERALNPYVELRKGPVQDLLSRRLAVLIVADGSILTPSDRDTVENWMNRGGTVLRFAGPRLGQKPDSLTPVALRAGDRSLGGAMSWTVPARLAPFESSSPFAGLTVPKDVVVSRQVLAQPALDLPNRTWARLADGTPLVTAMEKGRGRLILVHTTANTEWSNLSISGLFVEMLRRVVSLSQGISGARNQALPPVTSLDGFGRFTDPPAAAQPLPVEAEAESETPAQPAAKPAPPKLGPTRPPGFYGNDAARFALNLAEGMTRLTPVGTLPAGVKELELTAPKETDLKAILLAIALALLIID